MKTLFLTIGAAFAAFFLFGAPAQAQCGSTAQGCDYFDDGIGQLDNTEGDIVWPGGQNRTPFTGELPPEGVSDVCEGDAQDCDADVRGNGQSSLPSNCTEVGDFNGSPVYGCGDQSGSNRWDTYFFRQGFPLNTTFYEVF
jgi:hypothetical protein